MRLHSCTRWSGPTLSAKCIRALFVHCTSLLIIRVWRVFSHIVAHLSHCRLNRLSHTVYWKSPISVLCASGYEIKILPEKNLLNHLQTGKTWSEAAFCGVWSGSALFANCLLSELCCMLSNMHTFINKIGKDITHVIFVFGVSESGVWTSSFPSCDRS